MHLTELIALINPLDVSNKKLDIKLKGVHQDSRKVTPGSVFIAIRGNEVDGHMFLEDAIARGANVLICEESFYTDAKDVCVIEVESTREILGTIAQKFAGNPAEKLTTVGITGTNGKTTVATLVYQVLTKLGKKASLLGTVSKRILEEELHSSLTTSDPIELASDMKAMTEAGSEFLVMEVSSHALSQARVNGFDFNVAAFTNLSHDHLDYHSTVEEYAKAKKMLFDRLPSTSTAIVNIDDVRGHFMITDTRATVKEFSFKTQDNHILQNSANGLTLIIDEVNIKSPLVGDFNAYNVAEAFLICKALGFDGNSIAKALQTCSGASGRMETVVIEGDHLPVVIVDYAHTPDALENVLSTLAKLKKEDGKLICVFGAGGDRDPTKRPEMARAATKYADQLFVTSDNPRFENPDVIIDQILTGFEQKEHVITQSDRKEAIQEAIKSAKSNDIVLIAGKGHEDYQDIRGTKHPFNDYEIAEAALQQKKEDH
ncbi:MAG: UDP-N-acetylmuramoyl-L-alanyl-D-glutamate--2,6-diaminopimelate ligase [bacterium]|nr:UDP-N-acetylmuramoyl-L-alanyl-D-glutamate--2,6-diaminopimelate ligase [bacterium]